ncbi:hypothetical protein BU26DRAFT_518088 [Trematosphaeria pertusa]|uniref:Uncharacterized protein n=1 Tax=Trematosphaeria pertusa TaxID=390896 RepID=A0A6A6IM05_9PLEO|nr:uncharacterized protein BU26DRAFT_518088 [Trematosphaeria pertusa]KAF2251436.1 hypothetical protein BU26DRAFT_518088 [Trematosphaeria pertusa]
MKAVQPSTTNVTEMTKARFGLIDYTIPTVLDALPLEAREMVYEKAMEAGHHFDDTVYVQSYERSSRTRPRFLPAIYHTSKGILAEAGPVFIRNSIFVVSSYPANQLFTAFLESLPQNAGFKAVRVLRFQYFDCFPGGEEHSVHADLLLASRCPGLHTISLTFHVRLTLQNFIEVPISS